MARDDNDQNQEKDFLDIDLDEPLEGIADDIVAEVEAEQAAAEEAEAEESPIAAPVRRAGDGVLIYDNKRYAVGLNWLIAEEEGDTVLATQRAKDFKADFYCLRQGVATQHGFAYLSKGHRIGLGALASVAADALVGEWHGVFVADNGWWYMAVHSDNIAPDGDILFASEEAAYNHFIAQNEAFRWPRTYAPESWNIPDSTGEIPLNKVIGEAPTPTLKPVTLDAIFSGKRNKNMAMGALGVIVLLIIVSIMGQQLLPSLVPMQAQVPVPDVAVSDTLQAPPREPVILQEKAGESLTNMSLTRPSSMIAACVNGFSGLTIPLPGWRLGILRCSETFVEGAWNRESGSMQMVLPYLERFPEGVQRSFTDSSTLQATRRISIEKTTMASQELYERNYAIMALSDRFANMGRVTVKEMTPIASTELLSNIDAMQQAGFGLTQSKATVRPLGRDDLPYLDITLITKTPPNMIARYFDMPGVVMLAITSARREGTWNYSAKLILRPEKRLIEANNKAKALQMR